MAGYSGTPLGKKLGIKPGHRLGLYAAPSDFPGALAPLPDGVVIVRLPRSSGVCDVIVCFAKARSVLDRLPALKRQLRPDGGLWVAWYKRASGIASDVDENTVRDAGLALGLVDNKVCAIDELWSGLRLVVRVVDRPKAASPRARARPRS